MLRQWTCAAASIPTLAGRCIASIAARSACWRVSGSCRTGPRSSQAYQAGAALLHVCLGSGMVILWLDTVLPRCSGLVDQFCYGSWKVTDSPLVQVLSAIAPKGCICHRGPSTGSSQGGFFGGTVL